LGLAAVAALLGWVLLAAGPVSESASPAKVVSLDLTATLLESRDLLVEVEIVLDTHPTTGIPLSVLLHGDSTLRDVVAVIGETETPVELVGQGLWRLGNLPAPAAGERALLRYRVGNEMPDSGGRLTIRVPVLAPTLDPIAAPEVFSARVTLPSRFGVIETFPTDLRVTQGNRTLVTGSLPVVPRFITIDATTARPPLLPMHRLADLLTVFVLIVALAFGWRHLKALTP